MDLRYVVVIILTAFVWQYFDVKSDVENLYKAQTILYENQSKLLENQNDLTGKVYQDVPQKSTPLIVKPQSFSIDYNYEPLEYENLKIIKTKNRINFVKLDVFCLAKNIYHEARNEPLMGKYAVAQVTINRLHHNSYPGSICGVVMDPYQFSWANNKKIRWTHPSGDAWDESKAIAEDVLIRGKRVKGLEHALFYHANYVSPKWRKPQAKIAQVGNHIFYASAL